MDDKNRREEVRFTVPDLSLINVYDFAVAVSGDIAAIGSAYTKDGEVTTFVARIAPDHANQVVTLTWPFAPLVVTVGPDGSIWTIGRLKDDDNVRVLAEPLLRHYDASGKLVTSVLIRSADTNNVETSSMSASRDRVAWLSATGEYIEFSLDGGERERVRTPHGTNSFGINDDNDVIISSATADQTEFRALDRSARVWAPMRIEGGLLHWARILGFHHNTLVTTGTNGTIALFKAQ